MAYVHIPDDVLHNVFARLPAKSLLCSRCVSKHWNRLISDSNFMKSRSCRRMLLFTWPSYKVDPSLPVDNLADFTGIRDYYQKFQSFVEMTIAGTCNGLVLLLVPDRNTNAGHVQMILYNPFTRASKVVPNPYSQSTDDYRLYGFCCGATFDDLKIVSFRDHNSSTNNNWNTCDVFHLKTSLWSTSKITISDASFLNKDRDYVGIFAKGFLYWVASNKIVALSVEEMVISYVPLPVPGYPVPGYPVPDIVSGTLHGCFCMITESDVSFDFNVWVMKEHGIENPWSKAYSFRLPLEPRRLWGWEILNIMDDGRIFMVDCSDNLVIYDTLKHWCKVLATPFFYVDNHYSHAIEYDESLVSLSDICGFDVVLTAP